MANTPDLKADCKESTALELTKYIFASENADNASLTTSRDYFLTLYRQCYKATSGYALTDILKKE